MLWFCSTEIMSWNALPASFVCLNSGSTMNMTVGFGIKKIYFGFPIPPLTSHVNFLEPFTSLKWRVGVSLSEDWMCMCACLWSAQHDAWHTVDAQQNPVPNHPPARPSAPASTSSLLSWPPSLIHAATLYHTQFSTRLMGSAPRSLCEKKEKEGRWWSCHCQEDGEQAR